MRVLILAAAMLTSACASGGPALGDNPFPVERGSALAPPAPASIQAAPPQGAGPAGLDFGQWRSADPAVYAAQLQAQLRERYSGLQQAQIRADLEANGFACEESGRLDCRIEIMENACARDWYVVMERAGQPVIAGYDVMCLGAD